MIHTRTKNKDFVNITLYQLCRYVIIALANRAKKIKQINFTLLYIPGNENPAGYTKKIISINKRIIANLAFTFLWTAHYMLNLPDEGL